MSFVERFNYSVLIWKSPLSESSLYIAVSMEYACTCNCVLWSALSCLQLRSQCGPFHPQA